MTTKWFHYKIRIVLGNRPAIIRGRVARALCVIWRVCPTWLHLQGRWPLRYIQPRTGVPSHFQSVQVSSDLQASEIEENYGSTSITFATIKTKDKLRDVTTQNSLNLKLNDCIVFLGSCNAFGQTWKKNFRTFQFPEALCQVKSNESK